MDQIVSNFDRITCEESNIDLFQTVVTMWLSNILLIFWMTYKIIYRNFNNHMTARDQQNVINDDMFPVSGEI